MRWFFLFLLALNVFYYVWHQQQAPLRPKEIAPLSLFHSEQKNIRLLSESSEAPARRQVEEKPAAAPAAACTYLGSFPVEDRARQLVQRLLSLDVQASVQTVDASAGVDFWVYLPPLASRQASLWQLRELQARKIDSYIITEGDLTDGISLGIFQRKDSADSVVERLKSAGYEALVRELARSQHDYWAQVTPESARLVDDSLVRQLAPDFPELQKQTMPCKSVASPQ
ncbi:cell division septation protein DedD [Pseudomonas nitritireducens]|uniref:Cell division septation protein DedD n=1 Tax=Pseudomonas nitroreducens TaxID=46680 RepID=A0A7W7P450_PSENT|nr:SPOR domain-containing protein [Pseudomonas nitritireducens]MBB4865927.1 cell division septation protein DedD [Pseudomonas nitritireducens]